MSKDPFASPSLQSGYTGDAEPSEREKSPPINTTGLGAEENRGKRAPQSAAAW